MTVNDQKNNLKPWQRVGSRLRYGRKWLTVQKHHVGDIQTDRPVYVAPGAAVAGDVLAPKVVVSGYIFGHVRTDDLALEDGGQVWGDVFTKALRVEAGCKIHGWLTTYEKGATSLPDSTNLPEALRSLIDPNVAALEQEENETRVSIWRQLQAEAAAALLSRSSLEYEFEERVDEAAGEALAEVDELRSQLDVFNHERMVIDNRLAKLQETLQKREEQLQNQSAEMADMRVLLDERTEALAELDTRYEQLSLNAGELQVSKDSLAPEFSGGASEVEELVKRTKNLESALKGSFQHTSELEEALVRWQELAELTEVKVNELESEVATLNLQISESNQVVEMLRAQRDKIEEEWDRADRQRRESEDARTVLEASLAEASIELDTLRQEKQWLWAELSALKEQLANRPSELDQALEALTAAEAKADELGSELIEVQAETKVTYERLLWSQAAQEATANELADVQQSVLERDEVIGQLQMNLAEKQTEAEKWQNSVGRITDLLYEAEQKVKAMSAQIARAQSATDDEKQALHETARQRQLQIEAYQQEIEHLHDQIEDQGKRLAGIQASLIESEIAAEALRSNENSYSKEIERIKRLANTHIQKLEAENQSIEQELDVTKRKLNDLSVWLDRRRRRGEEIVIEEPFLPAQQEEAE